MYENWSVPCAILARSWHQVLSSRARSDLKWSREVIFVLEKNVYKQEKTLIKYLLIIITIIIISPVMSCGRRITGWFSSTPDISGLKRV